MDHSKTERENLKMSEALIRLAHICTCGQPSIKLENGTIVGVGPHTSACVSQIAIQALKPE